MDTERPWYVTLFERDWYDLLAPGGNRSLLDPTGDTERTRREVDFIAGVLGAPRDTPVLDLCCGWGRHAVGLALRGYAMIGLDLSAYHLELARTAAEKASVEIEWLEADMRRIPQPDQRFGTVINMFTAFGYFDDRENQQVLEEIARVLTPKGRFLLDVLNRDNLMRVYRDSEWYEVDETLVLERRAWDARTGRIHAQWTLVDGDGKRRTHAHDERLYTLQELELRLSQAGLRVIDAFGGYDGGPLERDSRRLIVLAEKP